MILSNNDLKKHIYGAVDYEENEGIIPYRFSLEKINMIKDDELRAFRHKTGSGIKIDFSTNAEEVRFKFRLQTPCKDTQLYDHYFFDVYVDNKIILHQGDRDMPLGTTGEISFSLKKEFKRVTIYLPCSALVEIFDFSVSDGSVIENVKYDKNVLFLGDSITHSAYIESPSMSYSNILARKMNYNILNNGIGGDIFLKEHLTPMPEFDPDIIFVAYGTNDWASNTPNAPECIKGYFETLRELYCNTEINVILPIWRKDINDKPDFVFTFIEIREMIKKSAEENGANVIDGFNFVPEPELLWWDGYLHPNESGFVFYADSLEKCIKNKG